MGEAGRWQAQACTMDDQAAMADIMAWVSSYSEASLLSLMNKEGVAHFTQIKYWGSEATPKCL